DASKLPPIESRCTTAVSPLAISAKALSSPRSMTPLRKISLPVRVISAAAAGVPVSKVAASASIRSAFHLPKRNGPRRSGGRSHTLPCLALPRAASPGRATPRHAGLRLPALAHNAGVCDVIAQTFLCDRRSAAGPAQSVAARAAEQRELASS